MKEYNVKVLQSAFEDITNAIEYYNHQKQGLGAEFYSEYDKVENRLAQNPYLYQVYDEEIRRANLDRFPYATYYSIEESEVQVEGVVHHSRNPNFIKKRLKNKNK